MFPGAASEPTAVVIVDAEGRVYVTAPVCPEQISIPHNSCAPVKVADAEDIVNAPFVPCKRKLPCKSVAEDKFPSVEVPVAFIVGDRSVFDMISPAVRVCAEPVTLTNDVVTEVKVGFVPVHAVARGITAVVTVGSPIVKVVACPGAGAVIVNLFVPVPRTS